MKPRTYWPSKETADRGIQKGQVLIVTTGGYSDYMICRVLLACRTISASEIEKVARGLPLGANDSDEPEWDYLYDGHLWDALVAQGILREANAIEINCESIFARDGGPAIGFRAVQDYGAVINDPP